MIIKMTNQGKVHHARLFFPHLTPACGFLCVEAVIAWLNRSHSAFRVPRSALK